MNPQKEKIFRSIQGGLIVSCQALPNEPLHGSEIMARMAVAAQAGGAVGIRANSVPDIIAIKKAVQLPVIALIKRVYPDSEVYITPTQKEVDEVAQCTPEIIAIDATHRPRPNGAVLLDILKSSKEKYPDTIFLADCATLQEALAAQEMGFDCVSTTLSGYTSYTAGITPPDFVTLREICIQLHVPVFAEGGIWTVEDMLSVFRQGIHACVIGTAITRPKEITQHFVNALTAGGRDTE